MHSADTLTLIHDAGALTLSPSTLLVAIDDTGNESFPPKDRCFGSGGCACLVRDYGALIETPWWKMKEEHFGGWSKPMHAADLRNLTEGQMQAVGTFFETNYFFRFACMAAESADHCEEISIITAVGALLMDRVLDIATVTRTTEVTAIFEHSQRLNKSVFEALSGRVISDGITQNPVNVHFLPKSANSAFLEVADFVMHSAGGQLRRRLAGKYLPTRKDFQSVFWRVPGHFSHHNELLRARRVDA